MYIIYRYAHIPDCVYAHSNLLSGLLMHIQINGIPHAFIILFFRAKPLHLHSKLALMWEGVRLVC